MAVVRWYLYALYLRSKRLRDRWLRPGALDALERNAANALFARYADIASDLPYAEQLRNRELKVSSQNGEDGLLAYIFAEIGATDRRFVEVGVEDGRECNCANLAIRFGWSGLMLEGDGANAAKARAYYDGLARPPGRDVKVVHRHVTAENVDEAITSSGFSGEIDLLSIDIDGNDYWIWKAIAGIRPRVIVIEYNASFCDRPITVPYDPGFVRFKKHRSGWYHGASLSALDKLGRSKGYDLVGTESQGVNAFFVRSDIAKGRLRTVSAGQAFRPQRKRLVVATGAQQFDAIRHLEYVEV